MIVARVVRRFEAKDDMEDAQTAPTAPSRSVIQLDPFDFFPTRRSALGGFGGTDGRTDPTYAFHTPYQPSAPGRMTFTVRLAELKVTYGTLVLRIQEVDAEHRAEPSLVNTAQVPLRTLAERGGEVSLPVRAQRDMQYALLGFVVDETDAVVSGITITLDRLEHGDTDADSMVADEPTRFGTDTLRPIPMLLTSQPPTFAAPLSQVSTGEQLEEPEYLRWAAALGARAGEDVWSRAYPLRVLEAFGMLAPGAHGLALGAPDEAMASAVMAKGCVLELFDPLTAADGAGVIPDDLRGFDFLWSVHVCDRLANVADGIGFMESTLACLNVGGIAVHMFRLVAAPAHDGEEVPGALVYARGEIERMVLALIVTNHEVAQMSYALKTDVAPRPTGFGLILRKGSF